MRNTVRISFLAVFKWGEDECSFFKKKKQKENIYTEKIILRKILNHPMMFLIFDWNTAKTKNFASFCRPPLAIEPTQMAGVYDSSANEITAFA